MADRRETAGSHVSLSAGNMGLWTNTKLVRFGEKSFGVDALHLAHARGMESIRHDPVQPLGYVSSQKYDNLKIILVIIHACKKKLSRKKERVEFCYNLNLKLYSMYIVANFILWLAVK